MNFDFFTLDNSLRSRKIEFPTVVFERDFAVECYCILNFVNRIINSFIHKLEGLASVHDGKELQRQVFVANRAKTMNEGNALFISNEF